MKTYIRNLFFLPMFIAILGFSPTGRVMAQTFSNLHNFTKSEGSPDSELLLSGNTLYGTTDGGGSSSNGTVFSVNIDGTGFTNLHSFAFSTGYDRISELVLSGNTLYGTTEFTGGDGPGTIFAINTDGTGFTNLHSFSFVGTEGVFPEGGLTLSSNTLYGTTRSGGSGSGTVFALHTDGSDFRTVYTFAGSTNPGFPSARLLLSDNILYGTTFSGGIWDGGTAFSVNTDGTGFTNLHSFMPAYAPTYTNSDGGNLRHALILSGNTLYGTTEAGGTFGVGTVFAVNTDGSGFTNLSNFAERRGEPSCALVLSGDTLYGVTLMGDRGYGTVFALHTNGAGFTNLYSFTGEIGYTNGDGSAPQGGLVLSAGVMYGTASSGGSFGYGTIFSLGLPLVLSIASAGNQSLLQWPTFGTNYILQSNTNLTSPNWEIEAGAMPGVVFTVTNDSPARFFRLLRQ